jgi:Cdc6-like AAA superfamily ATPase
MTNYISKLSRAIKDDTALIRQAIPTLETGANAVQQELKHQRHRTITDWISPVDFAAQQSDIISRRQEGTGLWFVISPEFLGWLAGSNQTLFCQGIPGAGKTIITAITVNHLWKYVENTNIGVAYIYCNYKTRADQTTTNLVATILKQLVQGCPSIAEPVTTLYERHASRRTRPSLEEILSALRAVVSNYSRVYVVVDALDECLDHNQLLATLRDLQSGDNLSLMATSRFIPEVVHKFAHSSMLEIRAIDSDVKLFVAGQMDRLPRFVQRDDMLQKAIQDGITMAAGGM